MKRLIAALAVAIDPENPGVIQLFPAGEFRALDGRPVECDCWLMTAEIAAVLIAAADARKTPYVLDYEHQTLRSKTNGQPAPAAAFFKTLEWREGTGLFATDVRWTKNAAAMVADEEYKFISPVFAYDKSGRVLALLHAALTNTPAVDDMEPVLLAAATLLATTTTNEGNTAMDELLERLRWMLNLPITATAEDITAELNKLIDQLSEGAGTTAASVDLLAMITGNKKSIAELTAQVATPDPAKWVSVNVMQQTVQQAVEKANAGIADLANRETETLITTALSDGRLLPAQEEWARSLGKSDAQSLRGYLDNAPKIAALTQSQTGGNPPSGVRSKTTGSGDDEIDRAVCAMLGTDPDEIAEFIKGEK
ncbi:hypothetical protein EHW64_13630 [Erwinia psidii]|uniref:phage protease n=1 Tax=Erwinia psidii TaxID=69224 RepID=UPI00226B9CE3|nr:phage protease [Erwinia psidii]MCX8962143.1 hypothetical protein [Erwinia psidii]